VSSSGSEDTYHYRFCSSNFISYAFAAFTLGGVIGPPLMRVGFDFTGSYSLVLGGFVVATLMAAGLMTRLGPYRTWEAVAEPA
jgi:hypothetical protein